MLKKQFRVTKEKDFQKVYKKGLFNNGKYLKINLLSNRRDLSRIAVVVSKKTEKKATKRNKVKRIVREAVKEIYLNLSDGYDIILNVKKEALEASKEDIKKDLLETLKKLRVVK